MGDESASTISLLATGDVGPVHGPDEGYPIERYSELVKPVLESADVLIGNCERVYSRRGVAGSADIAKGHTRLDPAMAQIFDDCGFDVLTAGNNHMFDWGVDGLLDTKRLLEEKGIKVVGSGRDLSEAHAPAIFEKKGVRVGFLSYGTQVAPGGDAQIGKPGIAFLRTSASYEVGGVHGHVRVMSKPNAADLSMIEEDIRELRSRVDVVIPAFHWGITRVPRVISDYQVTVGHACIDAGADMIIGHHAHVPKAIEVYRGKVIFYSLGNFCVTSRSASRAPKKVEPWRHGSVLNYDTQEPSYPLMPYGPDARVSLLAHAKLSSRGIEEVSFLPMMIDTLYRPEPLSAGDKRFAEVVRYMNWASEGFDHSFTADGDQVRIDPAAHSSAPSPDL